MVDGCLQGLRGTLEDSLWARKEGEPQPVVMGVSAEGMQGAEKGSSLRLDFGPMPCQSVILQPRLLPRELSPWRFRLVFPEQEAEVPSSPSEDREAWELSPEHRPGQLPNCTHTLTDLPLLVTPHSGPPQLAGASEITETFAPQGQYTCLACATAPASQNSTSLSLSLLHTGALQAPVQALPARGSVGAGEALVHSSSPSPALLSSGGPCPSGPPILPARSAGLGRAKRDL